MLLHRVFGSALLLQILSVSASTSTMSQACKPCNHSARYLGQEEAVALDQELFNDYKYSVDQLMELAGLSVATAIAKEFPASTHKSAIIICGPGNNGGDGLVAARHMTLFGYNVAVHYPKRTLKPLYENLLHQCVQFGVKVIDDLPKVNELDNQYSLVVDALFGFSFKPPVREALKPALDALTSSKVPVISVDIPSGWHVERGPDSNAALKPAMLVSLSAPKLCAKPEILGNAKHYLGGRFLPPALVAKYKLTLPEYPNQEQVVLLSC